MTSSPYYYWTPERVIEAMQEWDSIHSKPPRTTDWRWLNEFVDGHRRWPHVQTVVERFGSWNEGLAAAGLRVQHVKRKRGVHRKQPQTQKVVVTREVILDTIREWVDLHGTVPSIREVDEQKLLCRSTIYKRFGSWNEAIREAGFQPRPPGVTKRSLSKYLIPKREESHDVQS